MARSARPTLAAEDDEDDLYSAPTTRHVPARTSQETSTSHSPSPSISISSEKENRLAQASRLESGKSRSDMAPPSSRPGKRRRIETQEEEEGPTQAHQRHLEEIIDTQFYDPDQDINVRRAIRKGLRDLNRNVNDNRQEYLQPGSSGIIDTINRANELYSSVKQTSDATLDSRLLVTTADLSYKKTVQLTLGDTSQGVDVDEFVSKCIRFMRRGDGRDGNGNPEPPGSRRQGRRRAHGEDLDDEEGEDDGDALDWACLGREAFKHNLRPPVPGFLLGPLSLQKRVRVFKPRQGRQQRQNRAEEVRPEELKATDLEKTESSNLTVLCTKIRQVLAKVIEDGSSAAEAEATEDMTASEVQKVFRKYNICDDGGVNFYRFVINPNSFGQTVENMFYVSFLIRDGSAGIGEDSNGFPTLHTTQPRQLSEMKEQGVQKHQAVFNLSWRMWQSMVNAFEITESIIPERKNEENVAVGARGWYG